MNSFIKTEIANDEGFRILRATPSDYGGIAEIHNVWSIQNLSKSVDRGFLLLDTNPEKIQSLDVDGNMLLVAHGKQGLTGYLIAVRRPEMLEKLNWIETLERQITSEAHFHISEMAVQRNVTGKGIGKSLYRELLKQSHGCHLSAFVATAPFRNQSSIAFHEKMGFRTVATFNSPEFCGLQNYSSNLYFKNAVQQT